MRRAVADQLAMTLSQQLPGSTNHLCRTDFKQALIRTMHMAVAGIAGGTAQDGTARTERTVTQWIGWSEDRDYWNPEGCREMHGAGVVADRQGCPGAEGGQTGEVRPSGEVHDPGGGRDDILGQGRLGGPADELDRGFALLGELARS